MGNEGMEGKNMRPTEGRAMEFAHRCLYLLTTRQVALRILNVLIIDDRREDFMPTLQPITNPIEFNNNTTVRCIADHEDTVDVAVTVKMEGGVKKGMFYWGTFDLYKVPREIFEVLD